MSVPLEIQEEIMKRLPVRSLLQFRSLSKAWKSLIDSSDFITHYYASNQLQHLLVRYLDPVDSKRKFVSIVDDDTFPQQKVPLPIPMLVDMYHSYRIIGISHGLLCLYGHDAVGNYMAVVWNPSVRKSGSRRFVPLKQGRFWARQTRAGARGPIFQRARKIFKSLYIFIKLYI
ncbi:putative F-box domain-containing protein [Helianthus anomalus]